MRISHLADLTACAIRASSRLAALLCEAKRPSGWCIVAGRSVGGGVSGGEGRDEASRPRACLTGAGCARPLLPSLSMSVVRKAEMRDEVVRTSGISTGQFPESAKAGGSNWLQLLTRPADVEP